MAPTRGYFDDTEADPFGELHFGEPFMPATVNPQSLHHATSLLAVGDLAISSDAHNSLGYSDPDTTEWVYDPLKQDHLPFKQDHQPFKQDPEIDTFLNNLDDSPVTTNTHSPATDRIFSQSNSPNIFVRDHSAASSPEPAAPVIKQDPESLEAMFIPHARDVPHVTMTADKNKVRAETQIKMTLTLDPLDDVQHIKFPRKVVAKPKHYAKEAEKQEIEQKGTVLSMDVHLVCATACTTEEGRATALRRAAGIEAVPRKPDGKTVTELDKDDAAHPQNGGAVLICDGCIERERKRFCRKKKPDADEAEFATYEKDRVLMINEKEYMKFHEVEDQGFSSRARQVEFVMRIACYCRHQEEKSRNGYRVVFTFRVGETMLTQHISGPFYITDDHKNKESSADLSLQPLNIPQGYGLQQQYQHQSNSAFSTCQQYADYGMNNYSQPTTPIMSSQFGSPISPMDTTFPLMHQPMSQPMSQTMPLTMMPPSMNQPMPYSRPQSMPQTVTQSIPQSMPHSMPQSTTQSIFQSMPPSMAQPMAQPMPTISQQAHHPEAAFHTAPSNNAPAYPGHLRNHSQYETPMSSPSAQIGHVQTNGLPRPQSLDNFNIYFTPGGADFHHMQQNQYYNSAPPSAGGTPHNLSRPPSPRWEQGPNKKGKKW